MKRTEKPAARRRMKVVELDPVALCGRRTTVLQLFRVDERSEGRIAKHLVFRDRHGLYCDHGPDCVAVKCVMDSGKLIPATTLEWTT
jgi:hypothetical protein